MRGRNSYSLDFSKLDTNCIIITHLNFKLNILYLAIGILLFFIKNGGKN
jgi:hypothetical protein